MQRVTILHQAGSYPDPGAPDIPITWPFVVWGLYLLGPFRKVPRRLTHLLITVDKFTKWVVARPLAKIDSKQGVDFV
jgi:hypothetical protein